jgi:hypothetical protein
MQGDLRKFISDELHNPQNVLAMFSRYGFLGPKVSAVEKWFQRGSVPSDWLVPILALIELERGRPVSLAKYIA